MEKQSFDELRIKFIAKVAPFKQKVEEEFLKRKNGILPPVVVEGIPEDLLEVAEHMVELQNEKGFIARQDMKREYFSKLQLLAQKNGISNKEAVALLIENDRYMSPETVEVENLCNLIEDIFLVYQTHYENLQVFPINALNERSRNYLSNKKIPLSLANKLKIVLEVYLPELSEINIVDKSYRAVPRYKYNFNDEISRQIASEINTMYGDKNGLIDSLFLQVNKDALDKLLKILGERGISFEEFASKNGLNYTRCYSVNTELAVLQMLESYFLDNGTYQSITANDPYLRQKIDTAEEQSGIFSLAKFLNEHDVKNDVLDNGQKLTEEELALRENAYFDKIRINYPNGYVTEGFIKSHRSLYDEGLKLAIRKGYKSFDEFLAVGGITRVKKTTTPLSRSTIVLTERDLLNYKFYTEGDIDSITRSITDFDLNLVKVEKSRITYQKLVANGQDSSRIKRIKINQYGEN